MKNIIHFLLFLSLFILTGCEKEGYANYNDCREKIIIEKDSVETLYKTFVCSYSDEKKEKGACVNVETTDENECKKAYVYEK